MQITSSPIHIHRHQCRAIVTQPTTTDDDDEEEKTLHFIKFHPPPLQQQAHSVLGNIGARPPL